MSSSHIQCPHCHKDIDVNEAIYHQLEAQLKHAHEQERQAQLAQWQVQQQTLEANRQQLAEQQKALAQQQATLNEQVKQATQAQLVVEKQALQTKLEAELKQSFQDQTALLTQELAQKSEQVKALYKAQAEIEQLKRQTAEREAEIKAQAEQALTQQLQAEANKIRQQVAEQSELKLKQKEEQLEQLKRQLQEAQRKAEQGSMQLQGEVQELAIETWLKEKFPLDHIDEIKKGQRGADCIQIVNTREKLNCGKIYYESKRTKEFQKSWLEKFKADMRDVNADIGVLVTEAMPPDMQRMGLVEGIWVCRYEEFKGLSAVLRESIINLSHAVQAQENKTDKMGVLYQYLISQEFKLQMEAIVEGFTNLQQDLDAEKRAMQRIWKQREKQIEKVLDNTIGMYGSIRGIAGQAIAPIPALELGYKNLDASDQTKLI